LSKLSGPPNSLQSTQKDRTPLWHRVWINPNAFFSDLFFLPPDVPPRFHFFSMPLFFSETAGRFIVPIDTLHRFSWISFIVHFNRSYLHFSSPFFLPKDRCLFSRVGLLFMIFNFMRSIFENKLLPFKRFVASKALAPPIHQSYEFFLNRVRS